MADNTVEIKVAATGGDAAAKEVAKPTQAIKENTAALDENARATKRLITSGKEGAAPFDAVAVAAERAAARASNAASVVTTSVQQIAAVQAQAAQAPAAGAAPGGVPAGSLGFSGGFGFSGNVGIAAVGALISYSKAAHDAGEELRVLHQRGTQTGEDIAVAMRTNAAGAMQHAAHEARSLGNELAALDNKWSGLKIWNSAKESIGISGDTEKRAEIEQQIADRRKQQFDAGQKLVVNEQQLVELARLRGDAGAELTGELQRQLAVTKAIEAIMADPNTTGLQKFSLIKKTGEEAGANEKSLAKLKEDADAKELIRIAREAQLDEDRSHAQDEAEKKRAAEHKRISDHAAEEEAIAQKEHFDQWEQDKSDREEAAAASQTASDAARMEQMRDKHAELNQQLAGENEAAKLAEIKLKTDREIAGIQKSMAPERQAEAIAIAQQNADLEKQITIQKRLNHEAGQRVKNYNAGIDARVQNADKSPRQLSDERDAAKRQASHERAAITNEANAWAANERKNGRHVTDADIAAHVAAGKAARQAKNDPLKDPQAAAAGLARNAGDDASDHMAPTGHMTPTGHMAPIGHADIAPGGQGFYPGGGEAPATDTAPVANAQQQAVQQIVTSIAAAIAGASQPNNLAPIVSAIQAGVQAQATVNADVAAQIADIYSQIG